MSDGKIVNKYLNLFFKCAQYITSKKNKYINDRFNDKIIKLNIITHILYSSMKYDFQNFEVFIIRSLDFLQKTNNLNNKRIKIKLSFLDKNNYINKETLKLNILEMACLYNNNKVIDILLNYNIDNKIFNKNDFFEQLTFKSYLELYLKNLTNRKFTVIRKDIIQKLIKIFDIERCEELFSVDRLNFNRYFYNSVITFFIIKSLLNNNKNNEDKIIYRIINKINSNILEKIISEKLINKNILSDKRYLLKIVFNENINFIRNNNYYIILNLIKFNKDNLDWNSYFGLNNKKYYKYYLVDFLNKLYNYYKFENKEKLKYISIQKKFVIIKYIIKAINKIKNNNKSIKRKINNKNESKRISNKKIKIN